MKKRQLLLLALFFMNFSYGKSVSMQIDGASLTLDYRKNKAMEAYIPSLALYKNKFKTIIYHEYNLKEWYAYFEPIGLTPDNKFAILGYSNNFLLTNEDGKSKRFHERYRCHAVEMKTGCLFDLGIKDCTINADSSVGSSDSIVFLSKGPFFTKDKLDLFDLAKQDPKLLSKKQVRERQGVIAELFGMENIRACSDKN